MQCRINITVFLRSNYEENWIKRNWIAVAVFRSLCILAKSRLSKRSRISIRLPGQIKLNELMHVFQCAVALFSLRHPPRHPPHPGCRSPVPVLDRLPVHCCPLTLPAPFCCVDLWRVWASRRQSCPKSAEAVPENKNILSLLSSLEPGTRAGTLSQWNLLWHPAFPATLSKRQEEKKGRRASGTTSEQQNFFWECRSSLLNQMFTGNHIKASAFKRHWQLDICYTYSLRQRGTNMKDFKKTNKQENRINPKITAWKSGGRMAMVDTVMRSLSLWPLCKTHHSLSRKRGLGQ